MRAITRVETGRKTGGETRPWPWTINADGQGRWFQTRQGALDHARARLAEGADQVDVGCFQLNVGWHGRAFPGLDQMIDPARNARYAARFLAALHDEFGDWTQAAAAYHSRTPERGHAYLARLAAMVEASPEPGPDGARGRADPRLPLQPRAHGSPASPRLGSLVPLTGEARPIAAAGPAR
jgi:hypothetical protein